MLHYPAQAALRVWTQEILQPTWDKMSHDVLIFRWQHSMDFYQLHLNFESSQQKSEEFETQNHPTKSAASGPVVASDSGWIWLPWFDDSTRIRRIWSSPCGRGWRPSLSASGVTAGWIPPWRRNPGWRSSGAGCAVASESWAENHGKKHENTDEIMWNIYEHLLGTDIKLFELGSEWFGPEHWKWISRLVDEVDLTILEYTWPGIFELSFNMFQHVSTVLNRRCQLLARGVHSGVVGGNGRSAPPGPGACTQPGKTEAETGRSRPCAAHLSWFYSCRSISHKTINSIMNTVWDYIIYIYIDIASLFIIIHVLRHTLSLFYIHLACQLTYLLFHECDPRVRNLQYLFCWTVFAHLVPQAMLHQSQTCGEAMKSKRN